MIVVIALLAGNRAEELHPTTPPQELLVRVADHSGAGVRGAEVILFVEGGPFHATTDSFGAAKLQLRLQGDPSGMLVAQAPGYEILERTIQPLAENMIDLAYAAIGQRQDSCRHLAYFFGLEGSYSEWGPAAQELTLEQECVPEQEDDR
jgi:hypothetical protein